MLVCLMAVVLYPIFTLINSIKKGNMLFFVRLFKEKYYLCICIFKAVLEEKGKILQMVF